MLPEFVLRSDRFLPRYFQHPRAKSADPCSGRRRSAPELSRAAGKFPVALDSDLFAGAGDPAFKSAKVAVPVGVLVDEVAALRTVASDQVGRAPVSDFRVVPLLIR